MKNELELGLEFSSSTGTSVHDRRGYAIHPVSGYRIGRAYRFQELGGRFAYRRLHRGAFGSLVSKTESETERFVEVTIAATYRQVR